jgi:glycosyltransferase involved in cell wall biosynthesis
LLITVVMAMRNAEEFVEASAASVLAQEGVDLELVVVDDRSTDGSRAVVEAIARRDARLRVVDGPGTGIAGAVNAGFAAANGRFVCRCDSDDLYPPGRLQRQREWLQQHPDFAAVCGSFSTMDVRGRFVARMQTGDEAAEITSELRGGVTRTSFCTYLARTDAVRAIGGSRGYFEHAEDIDFQLRFGEAYRVWYEPSEALIYRLHDASTTHTQPSERRRFLDRMTREFQAERLGGRGDPLERGCAPAPPETLSKATSASHHVQQLLVGRAWRERAEGRVLRSLFTGIRACAARPWSPAGWRTVMALALRGRTGGG